MLLLIGGCLVSDKVNLYGAGCPTYLSPERIEANVAAGCKRRYVLVYQPSCIAKHCLLCAVEASVMNVGRPACINSEHCPANKMQPTFRVTQTVEQRVRCYETVTY